MAIKKPWVGLRNAFKIKTIIFHCDGSFLLVSRRMNHIEKVECF